MKEIIIRQFEALDGSKFSTEEKCIDYEKILSLVIRLIKDLLPIPEHDMSFLNGGCYVQQNIQVIENAKYNLTEYGNKILKINPPASFAWIGRYFDDSNNRVLYHAWNRLSNCDQLGREWGQGYYAIHSEKGKQIPYKE
jgi:hypothetical protein